MDGPIEFDLSKYNDPNKKIHIDVEAQQDDPLYDSDEYVPEPVKDEYQDYNRRERIGNNRYHIPKAVAKRKRQLARKSKQLNRRKK